MSQNLLSITYIGHATNLIEIQGQNFLSDPNFSQKILGFKRLCPLGIEPSRLPEISAILVSHAHYDHLDIFSYKYFKSTVPIICPKGLGKFIRKFLPNPLIEIPPHSHHVHHGVEIHTVPVHHHGARWLPIRNRAATAFVLKSQNGTVYYAGDSGPGNQFKETSQLFDIDVALLPIGGAKPVWLNKKQKLGPEEALQAFAELKAKHMIPICWGTFNFFHEKPEASRNELERLVAEKNLGSKVHILEPGNKFEIPLH
jgi:L-ascorbate metabolism protein UlaG (beta-lactamase superfamily)